MSIENFAPSDSRFGFPGRPALTEPDPSISECFVGSANKSKIFSGEAFTTSCAETDLLAIPKR